MASKKSLARLIFRLAVLIATVKAINSSDNYLKDLQKQCFHTRRPFFCVTYRLAKFIQEFDYQGPEGSVVKLIRIKPRNETSDFSSSARFKDSDSEKDKFVKFLEEKFVDYMSSHGIAFEVPEGAEIVRGRSLNDISSELQEKSIDISDHYARGHKKEKKIFILSVIIVAKLVKIMILVNLIFYALLFIKKILLITAVVFPSVLNNIKQACHQHQQQHHHHHPTVVAEEAAAPSTSWFGWRQDNLDKSWT